MSLIIEGFKGRMEGTINRAVHLLEWPPLFGYLLLGLALVILGKVDEAKMTFVVFVFFWILKLVLSSFSKKIEHRALVGTFSDAHAEMVVSGIGGAFTTGAWRAARILSPIDVTHLVGSLHAERHHPLGGDALDALGWGILASTDDVVSNALAQVAKKEGIDIENLSRNFKRLGTTVYDDEFRIGASLFALQHLDRSRLVLIGDARTILEKTRAYARDGMTMPLSGEGHEQLLTFVAHAESEGSRLLAVAYLDLAEEVLLTDMESLDREILGSHTIALGAFVVMDDPLVQGAAGTVASLRRAGIPLVIATGNSANYALAVLGGSGGSSSAMLVVGGSAFDAMSRDDIAVAARAERIFVDMTSERKERLERMLKEAGVLYVMSHLGESLPEVALRIAGAQGSEEEAKARSAFAFTTCVIVLVCALFSQMTLSQIVFVSIMPLLLMQFRLGPVKSTLSEVSPMRNFASTRIGLYTYSITIPLTVISLLIILGYERLLASSGSQGAFAGVYDVIVVMFMFVLLSSSFTRARVNMWRYGVSLWVRIGLATLPAILVFATIYFIPGLDELVGIKHASLSAFSLIEGLLLVLIPYAFAESAKYLFRK